MLTMKHPTRYDDLRRIREAKFAVAVVLVTGSLAQAHEIDYPGNNPVARWQCGDIAVDNDKVASDTGDLIFTYYFKRWPKGGIHFDFLEDGGGYPQREEVSFESYAT
jgi:hypothetical protein